MTAFELNSDTVIPFLVHRGLLSDDEPAAIAELAGGVSATVLAVRSARTAMVVKQALKQLKVGDRWTAKQERTELEAAALRLCDELTPGRVPRLIDNDRESHVVVMELLPEDASNWQSEVAAGRAHAEVGWWAGETLGIWHGETVGDMAVAAEFDDFESFEQLRLDPFYVTVIERLPEAAAEIEPRLEELRIGRCFVDGDFALKNTLVGPNRNWVLDFEVAHYGNPIFDLGFFLSFGVLSAIQWPALAGELRTLTDGFLRGYAATAGEMFAGNDDDVTAHTGCLVLARTDGKSPAQFLDASAREQARSVGLALLRTPEHGMWQWM